MTIHKPYEEKPSSETPRILPKQLQAKVRHENKPPEADLEKSKGELNEGRPHPEKQGGVHKQKPDVPPDGDTQGGVGSQGGMSGQGWNGGGREPTHSVGLCPSKETTMGEMKKGAEKQDEPLKEHGDKVHVESRKKWGDEKVVLSTGAPGDDRTPDQPIGEIAYALHSDERDGGAGEPETSKLEPEKQGGIGGP